MQIIKLKQNIKNSIISMTVIVLLGVVLSGCKNSAPEQPTDENGNIINLEMEAEDAATTPVITVGEAKVCLDEIRYYLYNTQATYEVFYNVEEKELDWQSEMSEGITLEEAVKSTILDDICQREVMIYYKDKYKVVVSQDEKKQIEDKADKFFDESSEDILEKIDITRERLVEIYEKDLVALKTKEIMNKEASDKSEEVYKKWKMANNVITSEYWNVIKFNEPIFE